jgi:hypothetical protein
LSGLRTYEGHSGREQRSLRILRTTLIVVVVGQRITVPVGALAVPLPLIAGYAAIFVLCAAGAVRHRPARTQLYVVANAAVLTGAWLTGLRGDDVSAGSLLLLLVTYPPWILRLRGDPATVSALVMQPLLRTFVQLMTVAALVGTGQLLAQWMLGWHYRDYLGTCLPEYLVARGYNTSNPISYVDPVVKANAFVFLEPSFLSQFLALALIIALLVRAPAWQPLVLGLGMAACLSGTGILLACFGLLLIVLTAHRTIRPSHVIAGIAGLAILFSTPAAGILLQRRDETAHPGSSGYARFVQPYTETMRGLDDDPIRYVIGAGPGSTDRLLPSYRSGGPAVVYPIVPKLAFEYGLVATVLFTGFLLVAILFRSPLPVLSASVGFMLFFLSGSLLQPHTTMAAWLLAGLWGRRGVGQRRRGGGEKEPPADGQAQGLGGREPVGGARSTAESGTEHAEAEHGGSLHESHVQQPVRPPGGLQPDRGTQRQGDRQVDQPAAR